MTDPHVAYGKKIARAIFMMSGDPFFVPSTEAKLAALLAQAFLEGQDAVRKNSNVIELAEVARRAGA
jgi:hypothetical protein